MISFIYKAIKKALNYLLRFVYRLKNAVIELLTDDYIILTSSVAPVCHNWGDDVSRLLVAMLNPTKKIIIHRYSWNLKKKQNYLCIGSMISWLSDSHSIIWGSGVVYPEQKLKELPLKVTAVRGPLTRDYLTSQGVHVPEIYGDPALLFPKFYNKPQGKKYKLGIIPHFRDKNCPIVRKLSLLDDVRIIDVQKIKPWNYFIDEIRRCDFVVSSSLHGIIVADAYNVPNVWIEFFNGSKKRFAFEDYCLSVNRTPIEPLLVDDTTTIDDFVLCSKNWKPISIDLDLLMSACPFIEQGVNM